MSARAVVPVHTLRRRQRFTLPECGKRGQLLRVGTASAHVRYPGSRARAFRTEDGETVTLRATEHSHISLSTMVVPGWDA